MPKLSDNASIFDLQGANVNLLVKLVETPCKFIIAELSIRKLGYSSFEFTRPFL